MTIRTQSPTRIDLAGGTLDCWPLYAFIGGSVTVNLSIDIFTGVDLTPRQDRQVVVNIGDLNYSHSFSDLAELLASKNKELVLLQGHLRYWQPEQGFEIRTWSQSPVGGGLGGSSSLCISLLKAFSQWLKRPLAKERLVTLASNIEAEVLHKPTGTQDYFPAATPGLNIIHYGMEGPQAEVIKIDPEALNSHLLLVYTGKPHHSGINNWQVIKSATEGDKQALGTLVKIASIAQAMENLCRAQKWEQLGELLQNEHAARIELSIGFNSPEVERLREVALLSGADAVKICGAGGGGCAIVWTQPERRADVEKACRDNQFQVLKARVQV